MFAPRKEGISGWPVNREHRYYGALCMEVTRAKSWPHGSVERKTCLAWARCYLSVLQGESAVNAFERAFKWHGIVDRAFSFSRRTEVG